MGFLIGTTLPGHCALASKSSFVWVTEWQCDSVTEIKLMQAVRSQDLILGRHFSPTLVLWRKMKRSNVCYSPGFAMPWSWNLNVLCRPVNCDMVRHWLLNWRRVVKHWQLQLLTLSNVWCPHSTISYHYPAALAQTLIWTFSGNWDFRGTRAELIWIREKPYATLCGRDNFSDKLQVWFETENEYTST